MARITTKAQLKAYILRQLGNDYIPVELSGLQLDDIITDALEFCWENLEGFSKDVAYELDTSSGATEYTLDDDVYQVLNVVTKSTFSDLYYKFPSLEKSPQVVDFITSLMTVGRADLVDYNIFMQDLNMYNKMFTTVSSFSYNFHDNKFIIYEAPTTDYIILFVNKLLGFDDVSSATGNMWNNKWFKEYCLCLAEMQWARNLRKFRGLNLPGGGEINFDEIYNNAKEDKKEKEEWALSNLVSPDIYGFEMG